MLEIIAATTTVSNIKTPVVPPQAFATDLGTLINFGLQVTIGIAVLAVFASLIIGGVSWIISGGDKAKTEKARDRIVAAIVGLVILVASYAILLLLLHLLGYSSINDVINHIQPINSATGTATPSASINPSGTTLRQQNLVK